MENTTERMTPTVIARIPRALSDHLDALAKSTGRNKNALIEAALNRFIEIERWQIALIEDRVRQADAGNFASDEEVARVYAKFNIPRREYSERTAG